MAEFTVEFYETSMGASPVEDFLEELKASDPGDHAAVLAGLANFATRSITVHRCARLWAMNCLSCGM